MLLIRMELEDVLLGIIIGGLIAIPLFYLLSRPPLRISTFTSVPKTVYKNTEEWEIIKNRSGRTTGVRVKRTAIES